MTEEIVVVPWSSDSEWQSVRRDIYANKDTRNYNRALRKLVLWKARGQSLTRGLHCTELILQVITKDNHFCDVNNGANENDLIRLYSMAIMKFVNLTADVLRKGPQKSMYFRASCIELPSWLIDMRHKISHDQDLPTLKSLRTAMEFSLDWLQKKYWNEDQNFLVISPKLNMDVVDEFIDILEFYTLRKIQTDKTFKEEKLNVLRNKLSMPNLSNKECIKRIKTLLTNKVWSPQLANVFVTRYLLRAQKCNVSKGKISKTDKVTWSVLLKIMNTSGLMTNILQCLVTQNSYIAALWVVELCIVYYNSKKQKIKYIQNNNFINSKNINLDKSLVLRTALNSTHKYTRVFLKWLLTIQSHQLTIRQKYYITKLVSLYMGSLKINYTINDHIFTVDDVISKSKNQLQSQWSLAIGQTNWRHIPFGTTL